MQWRLLGGILPLALIVVVQSEEPAREPAQKGGTAVVLTLEGKAEFSRSGSEAWDPGYVGQQLHPGDRLRTAERTRVVLRVPQRTTLQLGELSLLELRPSEGRNRLSCLRGLFYFFHRDTPGRFDIDTPTASAFVRGSEFHLRVAPDTGTTLTILDGCAELVSTAGSLLLQRGEEASVSAGQSPRRTAALVTTGVIQWCYYYPGVLNLEDLPLQAPEMTFLADSLAAYASGDLPQALSCYPSRRVPHGPGERLYLAALLLTVGQVEEATRLLDELREEDSHTRRLAGALRAVMATVRLRSPGQFKPVADTNDFGTEWLAESYCRQAHADLEGALAAARRATEIAPEFGFAWTRVAELEFSFGRVRKSREALANGLRLVPRHAEAHALRGFLFAAAHRTHDALACFEQATAIDGALGNAWLGRGLCEHRLGRTAAGLDDLQVAATLEPQRALLRSYLAKAFGDSGNPEMAAAEITIAKRLDSCDPTAWLYGAFIERDSGFVTDAIESLEKSRILNNNRGVFRSRLLLDQDRAVRAANLASLLQDANLAAVAVNEAARATADDYANHSAHLFMADSFSALRDPTRFALRYETAWLQEFLVGNLLAPVGGGNLATRLSQGEYARLFEANRLGLSTDTTVRSDGQFREFASQFGTYGGTEYALDCDAEEHEGSRPENDLSRVETAARVRQAVGPLDTLLFIAKSESYHSGDNFQYYDPASARPSYRYDESQSPILLAGYHHEWNPGMHTLIFGGRLRNDAEFRDLQYDRYLLFTDAAGLVRNVAKQPMNTELRRELDVYTGEFNQILQDDSQSLVVGSRLQGGTLNASARLSLDPSLPAYLRDLFPSPPSDSSQEEDFGRFAAYTYYTREILTDLWVTAGLTYDRVQFPSDSRAPPIAEGVALRDGWLPKAALLWNPTSDVTLRAAYGTSLSGESIDDEYRLEPSQLAGFIQSFRSVIPESVVGSVSAARHETAGVALDIHPKPRLYLCFEAGIRQSHATRSEGVFTSMSSWPYAFVPSRTPRALEYTEWSLVASVSQLVGSSWALGAQYRLESASLKQSYTAIPTAALSTAQSDKQADLHSFSIWTALNHPSGLFARLQANAYAQRADSSTDAYAARTDEAFAQLDVHVGYRFWRRRGELTIGVLNITDTDYHIDPLNVHLDWPRERVLSAQLKLLL